MSTTSQRLFGDLLLDGKEGRRGGLGNVAVIDRVAVGGTGVISSMLITAVRMTSPVIWMQDNLL
jgi:hypothetical protein